MQKQERLYIVGHPVAHSKSPVMHNAAYRALGLDWFYDFADCPSDQDARGFFERGDWLAANITMPYKPLAFDVATWQSDAARLARGANVLVRRGEELLADNTDGKGCVSFLQRCGVSFEGSRIVVCGTGPTSLAIMHAAAQAGAAQVALLGRDEAKAARVLDAYAACLPDASGVVAASYARTGLIEEADVIVDATPLGMHEGDPAPFDVSLLSGRQTVFDVVYGHGETALVAAARAAGCAAYDGAGMLVAQAVETVRDITSWLDIACDIDAVDLFSIMSNAAGFDFGAV